MRCCGLTCLGHPVLSV